MRCGCLMFISKMTGRVAQTVCREYKTLQSDHYAVLLKKHGKPKICDGKMNCTIKAVDTPDYCSDHYAELEINWRCSKGGSSHFLFHPLEHKEIEALVTKALFDMTEEEYDKRVQKELRKREKEAKRYGG